MSDVASNDGPLVLVLPPASDAAQRRAALAIADCARLGLANLFLRRARMLTPPDPVLLAVADTIRATQFYVAWE